ncbi:MAG: DUF3617 domain-containing protein [Xanthobacteraceae bacterium]
MVANRVALWSAATVAAAAVVAFGTSIALAGGIEPGLWKITTVVDTGGMSGSPRQSTKCLTAEQVANLAATFSPIANTVNSVCAPMERSFDGKILKWHLVCTGQLDMELTGEFNFDSPHHYIGAVQSKASMAGQPMPESKNTVEGEWVSACPQ